MPLFVEITARNESSSIRSRRGSRRILSLCDSALKRQDSENENSSLTPGLEMETGRKPKSDVSKVSSVKKLNLKAGVGHFQVSTSLVITQPLSHGPIRFEIYE